jgi:hypothetical protein
LSLPVYRPPERETKNRAVRDDLRAENQMLFRHGNEVLRKAVEDRVAEAQRVPFLCECADPFCEGRVELTLEEYRSIRAQESHFAIVPGHPGVEGERIVEEHEGFHIAEKPGEC